MERQYVTTIKWNGNSNLVQHSVIKIYQEGEKFGTEVFRIHYSEEDYKLGMFDTLQEVCFEIEKICEIKKDDEILALLTHIRKKLETQLHKKENKHTIDYVDEAIKWQRQLLKQNENNRRDNL